MADEPWSGAAAREGSQLHHRDRALVWFLAAHGLLALLLCSGAAAAVATLHAVLTVVCGLTLAWTAPRRYAALVVGYVAGAEVLWRMAGASIFWETGKYACVLVCIVALWKLGTAARFRLLPIAFFLLLLPAVVVLGADDRLSDKQIFQMVSFNLSGPLALAVCTRCLSHLASAPDDEERLLLAILAPVLAIGLVTAVKTATAVDLTFTDESNFTTSGGFGPNQVSTALGLGAFAAFLLFLRTARGWKTVAASLAATLFLVAQTTLTLSRGGLYGFAIASAASLALAVLRGRRARRRLLLMGAPAVIVVLLVMLPRLNAFTGGALQARLENTRTSGRTAIMSEDIRIWDEHLVLGTGPGAAKSLRQTLSAMSHTEYTRLIAEHGIFGLLALGVIAAMALLATQRALRSGDAAVNAGMLAWSLVSMSHAGMRIAAISVTFAIAAMSFAQRDPGSRR